MLAVQIILVGVLIILLVLVFKVVVVEKKFKDLESLEDICVRTGNEVLELKNAKVEVTVDNESRYYAVCVCQKPNKTRTYFSFTTDDVIKGYPTEDDLAVLRQNVLNANPEYTSCEIIFFSRIQK